MFEVAIVLAAISADTMLPFTIPELFHVAIENCCGPGGRSPIRLPILIFGFELISSLFRFPGPVTSPLPPPLRIAR